MQNQNDHVSLVNKLEELKSQVFQLTGEVQELKARLSDTGSLLTETQSKYLDLINNSPDIIYTHDLDGNYTSCSSAAEDILGYKVEDILTMNMRDIVHTDYIPLADKNLKLKLENDRQVTGPYELLLRSSDGGAVWVELYSRLIKHEGKPIAIQGFARDITKRKKTEKELKLSEESYRGFLENFQGIAFRSVPFEHPFVLDGAVQEITGYTKHELMSDSPGWRDIIHPDDLAHFEALVQKLSDSQNFFFETDLRIVRKNGQIRWLSMFAQNLFNEEDRTTIIQGALYDVSHRKEAGELALKSERWKALEDLAGGIAHNFNNIFQIILSGGQLVLSDIETGNLSDATEVLDLIVKNCKIGAQTVKRIETLAGITTNNKSVKPELLEISEVARQATRFAEAWWRRKADSSECPVILKTDFENECYVWGSGDELFSIIFDLLKNAYEAIRKDGEIRVVTHSDDSKIIVEISDTGVGIEPEFQDKIFTPFFTTKMSVGSGLGLSTCLRIVQAYGGDIQYHQSEGHGSVFEIKLPRAFTQLQENDIVGGLEMPQTLEILLIEDDEHVLRALKERFRTFGHNVTAAQSGFQALDIFENHKFDLVVCDLGMPEMSGLEVANKIKTMCELKKISRPFFIILTGWGIHDIDPDRMAELGVDEILQKPVDLPKLFSIVRPTIQTSENCDDQGITKGH